MGRRRRTMLRRTVLFLVLAAPVPLSGCFGCPPGAVGHACIENAIQVTNVSDEPIVIVVANPDSTQSRYWVARHAGVYLRLGEGECLAGDIEVWVADGQPGQTVAGDRLGELDAACTGDRRTWWGDERDER